MKNKRILAVAATAILSLGLSNAAMAANMVCTFNGGQPGPVNADGDTGPFQVNDKVYIAADATAALASKAARLACTSGEALGKEGCFFAGCVEADGAAVTKVSN